MLLCTSSWDRHVSIALSVQLNQQTFSRVDSMQLEVSAAPRFLLRSPQAGRWSSAGVSVWGSSQAWAWVFEVFFTPCYAAL